MRIELRQNPRGQSISHSRLGKLGSFGAYALLLGGWKGGLSPAYGDAKVWDVKGPPMLGPLVHLVRRWWFHSRDALDALDVVLAQNLSPLVSRVPFDIRCREGSRQLKKRLDRVRGRGRIILKYVVLQNEQTLAEISVKLIHPFAV